MIAAACARKLGLAGFAALAVVATAAPENRAPTEPPPDQEALRVEALLAAGRQDAAEEALADLAARHREHVRLSFLFGSCIRSRFNVGDAAKVFAYVARLAPESKEGLCSALIFRMDAGRDVERSFDALRMLVERHPDDAVLLWMLAVQCRARGCPHEGVHHYGRLARLWQPGPVMLHQTYANLLDEIDSHERALAVRTTAVSMERTSWSMDAMASTLSVLGRHPEAERLYRQVLKMTPDDADRWTNYGICLKRSGRYEDAMAAFAKADRLAPDSVRTLTCWLECLMQLDRLEEALEKCVAIQKVAPLDAWSKDHLDYLSWLLNRTPEGSPMYTGPSIMDEVPGSPTNPADRARAACSLIDAASAGDRTAVAALLAWGADIASTNEHGCTALHHAAEYGNAQVVADLLKAGAKVEARNRWRQTPLYVAAQWTTPRVLECVRLLLAAGADPNTESAAGSALRYAVSCPNPRMTDLLLKAGATADGGRSPNGATPLARTCGSASIVEARWFVAHGADPNARDQEGRTPLMYALLTPQRASPASWAPDLVSLLIRSKADPNIEDKDGSTALDWAACVGHEEAVEYLKLHGATRDRPRFPSWKPASDLADGARFALACEASLICITGGRLGIPGGLSGKQPATRKLREYWACGSAKALHERIEKLQRSLSAAADNSSRGTDDPAADPAADPAGWIMAETARRYRTTGLPGRDGIRAPADSAAPRLAWECVEYLHLCALGRTAEWVPAAEAARRIDEGQSRLAAAFDSWDAFGIALETGQRLLRPADTWRYRTVFARLADREDPNNPRTRISWPKRAIQ